MTEEEGKQNLIDRYVMLLQIKAAETATNKQLDMEQGINQVNPMNFHRKGEGRNEQAGRKRSEPYCSCGS